jgi:phenylpropionate dioxygenase-like ring-hydroxylating dioxygenase large terminal subunit
MAARPAQETTMFVKNCWYVAGWSHEVSSDGFLARTIINAPLVLWRDSTGEVIAFDDRCCHRGAPLSKGRREGDCVRCMYHGLKFDKTGQCIEAPAQDRLPPQLKVRTYPVVERNTWVWVWMGDPARTDESLLPQTPYMGHPEWRHLPGYLHYDVDYLLIADNLLDFSHLPFLHPTTLGGSPDYARVLPQIERLERGVRTTRWVFETDPPAYTKKYVNYGDDAKVDRWMLYDFLAPSVLLMDAGMAPAGSGAQHGNLDNALQTRSYQALTPETETSTHYFFTQAHNFHIDKPEVTQALTQALLVAFEEDRDMITAQQRNLALDPGFKMVPLSVDSALSQFRWVLGQLAKQDGEPAPARPMIPIHASA